MILCQSQAGGGKDLIGLAVPTPSLQDFNAGEGVCEAELVIGVVKCGMRGEVDQSLPFCLSNESNPPLQVLAMVKTEVKTPS